jgi:hypothetical protein
MQQTIVIYECMNRKGDVFWEFGGKNHGKQSLESKDMALEAFSGKMIFLGGSGIVLNFLEWLEGLLHKRHGSCQSWEFFGVFLWNFGGFKVV